MGIGQNIHASIVAESARFNLNPPGVTFERTLHIPLEARRFLRKMNQSRSRFDLAGEERTDVGKVVVLKFREEAMPRLISSPLDEAASGRFWIEPASGAVVRSELPMSAPNVTATITVTYRLEPSLGFRIPIEMRERYDNPRDLNADGVVALATYSDFRRFDWRTMILPGPPMSTGFHDRFRGMRAVSAAFSAFHK